jgi:hypothetical protein
VRNFQYRKVLVSLQKAEPNTTKLRAASSSRQHPTLKPKQTKLGRRASALAAKAGMANAVKQPEHAGNADMKNLASTTPVSETAIANAASFTPPQKIKKNWNVSISTHGFKSFKVTFSKRL